ncbi:MAG TPA: hypothetical protein VN723_05610 [Rhizomicrobium sp.]|jgi:hypothetical protein|nr:hypothetical protein [Rhizomicrobium sp.]
MQTVGFEILRVPRADMHYRFASGDDPEGQDDRAGSARPFAAGSEDLPFKVEVWSEDRSIVEQTLAITANGSIGYAAYYEATREYPNRYITLRHRKRVLARWNPPDN